MVAAVFDGLLHERNGLKDIGVKVTRIEGCIWLNVVLEFKDLNVEAFGFSQRHDLFENFGCRTGSDADAEFLEIPGISGKSGAARKNGGKRQQCGCQCDVAAFHSVGSSLFFDMGRTFEYRAVAVLMKCSLCTARPI